MNNTQKTLSEIMVQVENYFDNPNVPVKATLWNKGDKERVYLNGLGYNTKKCKTTCYVYVDDNDEIGISVYVDCRTQPYAWVKNVKEEVVEKIENFIQFVEAEIKRVTGNA